MNEPRDAIERVGAGFDPPGDGLDDLHRRRQRTRTRRRLTAGAVAVTVAAGGSILAVRALPTSPGEPHPNIRVLATGSATSSTLPTPAPSAGTTCPGPSSDDQTPVVLSSTSGAAGSTIDVKGTFFDSDELWMQLWWNAGELAGTVDAPPWPPTGPDLHFTPAGPGPVVDLASIAGPATTGHCSFQATFTVPRVRPGTYRVQWVFGDQTNYPRPDGGYVLLSSELTFQVTE